jgi:O-antigen/teichoic acid export membrane protein
LLRRSSKYILLLVVPVFVPLAVFAREILHVWLGPTLAGAGATVLQILAVGAAFQVIGVVPSSAIRALGRPDVVAKLYMLEVPLFVGASWWLVRPFGIDGVACAWSGRLVLHVLLLVLTAHRMGLWAWRSHAADVGRVGAPVVLLIFGATLTHVAVPGYSARVVLMAGLLAAFYLWAWTIALGADERRQLLGAVSGWRRDRR